MTQPVGMSRGTKALIGGFGTVVVVGMVLTGVFNYLLAGDDRVVVVTMQQGAGQGAREELKRDCGTLPGVTVVPDRGRQDPQIQGRFPVRFSIAGATPAQEAALTECLNRHPRTVRGFLVAE